MRIKKSLLFDEKLLSRIPCNFLRASLVYMTSLIIGNRITKGIMRADSRFKGSTKMWSRARESMAFYGAKKKVVLRRMAISSNERVEGSDKYNTM